MAVADPTLQRSTRISPYLAAGLFGWLVIAVTTVHHVWGAVLYDTPWRLHIVFIGAPIALVFSVLLWLAAARHRTGTGRALAMLSAVLIVGFCTLMLGVYEGGYNHLLKNIVYFTHGAVGWMFPDGVTGIPDDFVFEATGIAHFPTGILAAIASWRVVRWAR
jgi:hypothetical protein